MDDRELEQRLQAHFHRTLDNAQPSPELRSAVSQAFATPARRVGLFDLRGRGRAPAWGLLAAGVIVSVVAIAASFGFSIGQRPGAQPSATTPTPIPTPAQERWFVVVPRAGGVPDKATTSLASDVMSARLQALGFGNFSSSGGFAIQFELPVGGPSDESTRRVLTAAGDVKFVPLPAEDYGDGKLIAEVGKRLPKDEPALFGWEGIESLQQGTDQQDRPTLNFTLKPAASQAFGDYTTAHVWGYVAIVIDGVVASAPLINEPITGGEIQISSAELPGNDTFFRETIAILIGGMLPERWQGATSPKILTRDQATAIAAARFSNLSVTDSRLYVTMRGDQPRPIWSIDLKKTDASGCEGLVADDLAGCLNVATEVRIVATTGEILTLQAWDDAAPPSTDP
jgi:hypothetical protein